MAGVVDYAGSEAVSLYLALEPDKPVDLEVAASMAIEWARGMKSAGEALDSTYDYRVNLIAAKPGSSKWLAKIERSKINQITKEVQAGWEELPAVLRATIALVVVIPMTAVPTINYWLGEDKFTPTQIEQVREAVKEVIQDEAVKKHKSQMYKEAQKD